MSKLILKPHNQELEVDNNKSIYQQMINHNVHINSTCGGFGTCGDCVVKIVKGEDQCSPPSYQEIKLLGNVFHLTHERLSCQLQIKGEVEIDISKHQNSFHKKQPTAKTSTVTKRRKPMAEPSNGEAAKITSAEELKSPSKEGGFKRPKRRL